MFKYRLKIPTAEGKTVDSWGLMPIEKECAFVDGVYNPEDKSLTLLVDSSKDYFMNIAVKDEQGNPVKLRGGGYKVKEVQYPKYYEHVLTDDRDIQTFMVNFVMNNFSEEKVEEKEVV